MATLKQRLHRKNAAGTFDTVHLESSSDLILRPSGRTVEQDLADYLPRVQNNDNVPQTLNWVRGSTKAFVNGKEIAFKDSSSSGEEQIGDIILSTRDMSSDENYLPCDGKITVTESTYPNLYVILKNRDIDPLSEPLILTASQVKSYQTQVCEVTSASSIGYSIEHAGQLIFFKSTTGRDASYTKHVVNPDTKRYDDTTTPMARFTGTDNVSSEFKWLPNKNYALSDSALYDTSSGYDYCVGVMNTSKSLSYSGMYSTINSNAARFSNENPFYCNGSHIYWIGSYNNYYSFNHASLGNYQNTDQDTVIESTKSSNTYLTDDQNLTIITSASTASVSLVTVYNNALYRYSSTKSFSRSNATELSTINGKYDVYSIAYVNSTYMLAICKSKTTNKWFLVKFNYSSGTGSISQELEFSYVPSGLEPSFPNVGKYSYIFDPSVGFPIQFGTEGQGRFGYGKMIGQYFHIYCDVIFDSSETISGYNIICTSNGIFYGPISNVVYSFNFLSTPITVPDVHSNLGIAYIRCK